jgi:hypothetical protein
MITLTDFKNNTIKFNPYHISVLAVNTAAYSGHTEVYTLNDDCWYVKQTPDEIEEMINKDKKENSSTR